MNPADILAAVTPVVEALERLGVRHHIGGSVASSALGVARATLDVDLVADLSREHVGPLVAALRDDYYAEESAMREAVRRHATFNLIHLATMMKVDVFVLKTRPYGSTSSMSVWRASFTPSSRESSRGPTRTVEPSSTS